MSETKPGSEQVKVSIEELVARMSELKGQLEVLEATINTYLSQYRELQLAHETLKNLPDSVQDGYVVIDRLSAVMIPSKIEEGWSSRVLVNLGLGYYIKTTREKAMEILSNRIRELEKVLRDIQARHQMLLREYSAIQRILSQVAEARQSST
jgi:prefoldin alpha subunit